MHLVGSFISSGLWPPTSYRMLLEYSMPTSCYFQWNSWKIWNCYFRMASFKAASLRPFDLWPSYWGIIMLKQQKKSICAASERLLIRWSKLLALLCLEIYIFFDLDYPALIWLSSLGLQPRLVNCQTLAGQPSRSRKMKILMRQRNFAIELCHLLSKPSEAAQNIYSFQLWTKENQVFISHEY